MGPKGNIAMGILILAVGAIFLALCSSTAIHEYIGSLIGTSSP